MFKNYLLIALRNLFKNKLYSAINIVGLAIGLAACLMLMLLIVDQSQYDQFWADADDIYRIESTIQPPGQEKNSNGTIAGKAKQTLLNYFPEEIQSITRFNAMAGYKSG
jgi:putative ABC transport system permease protein